MDLDTDWIDDFNNEEKQYNPFYPKEVTNVRIVFLYLNEKNELVYSKKFIYPVKNEIISNDKLMHLLKKNIVYNNRSFYPTYLFRYNMDIRPENINRFIHEPQRFTFFKQVNYMREIPWEKTIDFFQPLNRLYIFMKNRSPIQRGSTKKIYISKKSRKKTRRKYI